jgi:hypothetical protein
MMEKAASRFMSVSFSMDGKPYDAMPMVDALTQRTTHAIDSGQYVAYFVSKSQSGTVMDA